MVGLVVGLVIITGTCIKQVSSMPASEHPYLVFARDLGYRDALMARYDEPAAQEAAQEDEHMPQEYEYDRRYYWNVSVPTPSARPWIGLNQIQRILNEVCELHSPESIRNNAPEYTQRRHIELSTELQHNVPGLFLQSFHIVSPEEANLWSPIHWTFECFPNGLDMTSPGRIHRIAFHWDIEEYTAEDDVVSRMRVVTVQYTGPFELEEVDYDD